MSCYCFEDAAGFRETVLSCNGQVYKDCSPTFCMSRQGIININKASSIFSFRKRCKFTKMAEHFEYNHIPAQLSSIQNFHVKSVLCYRNQLVVLHLVRNLMTQFGLLNLEVNKFLGIFGKQTVEFCNEVVRGELSPDETKCLIFIPGERNVGLHANFYLKLFDVIGKKLISSIEIGEGLRHFVFDPRYSSSRVTITNFEAAQINSMSAVNPESWQVLVSNHRINDTMRGDLYPYMKDLKSTPDGFFLVATLVDDGCTCRERKTKSYRLVDCSIYVFNADTLDTLHCIQYQRFTCGRHLCPVSYTPVFSICGNRMSVVVNVAGMPTCNFVQVYKLPNRINLQSMTRTCILQAYSWLEVSELLLPQKLWRYLHFKPEYP